MAVCRICITISSKVLPEDSTRSFDLSRTFRDACCSGFSRVRRRRARGKFDIRRDAPWPLGVVKYEKPVWTNIKRFDFVNATRFT